MYRFLLSLLILYSVIVWVIVFVSEEEHALQTSYTTTESAPLVFDSAQIEGNTLLKVVPSEGKVQDNTFASTIPNQVAAGATSDRSITASGDTNLDLSKSKPQGLSMIVGQLEQTGKVPISSLDNGELDTGKPSNEPHDDDETEGDVPGDEQETYVSESAEVSDASNGPDQISNLDLGSRSLDQTPEALWVHPVAALIESEFDMSNGPYGAGNRAIEYNTSRDSEVVAVADGVVTFAGNVAGTKYVTVLHEDGLRSTYGKLLDFYTKKGDKVAQAQMIASTEVNLILTARDIDDNYLNPAAFLPK